MVEHAFDCARRARGFTREAAKIPYRVRRDIGKLKAGDIFVRHGSQTEPPTEPELESLVAKGERARSAD